MTECGRHRWKQHIDGVAQAGQRRSEGEDGVRQEWERKRCKKKPQMREYGPYIGHVRLQSEVEGRARGTF